MDQHLPAGDFCLPSDFLNDAGKLNSGNFNHGFYSFSSNGTNYETESDEEDYLNGLNFKFANTSINEDVWKLDAHSKSARVLPRSPQSTLCGCKHGSSRGSPNCPSPPAAALEANYGQNSLDILYAAAGEVARMRMVEEAAKRKYQQLQVAKFQELKRQQIAKQLQYVQIMLQNKVRYEIAKQQQQQQRSPGSGMRAVFLGNGSTKRESMGTGVFLPRQSGNPTEQTQKRGCSTVLLPERVVQALNLTMEPETKIQSRCNSFPVDADADIMYQRNANYADYAMMPQQRRNNHRQQQPAAAVAEFRLPQEWTY